MKNSILLILTLCCGIAKAQMQLTVCQSCGSRDWIVFYKDGSDTAVGRQVNDSCVIYDIPIAEPVNLAILTEENTHHILSIWADPRVRSRRVTVDNCTKQLIKHDTIPLDRDHVPYDEYEKLYMNETITRDSFDVLAGAYAEQYIRSHPDSFLAVKYLEMFMYTWDIARLTSLHDFVKKTNTGYPLTMRKVDNYINNYQYKGTPKIGDPFLEFKAYRPDGSTFDSKTISDKVVVLFFWYSGCGPCKRAIEPLNKTYEKYKASGLEVISYSTDDSEALWKKTSAEYKFPGVNVGELKGFSSPIANHYGLNVFPTFVVFDRQKRISMMTFGEEVPLVESKVKELLGTK